MTAFTGFTAPTKRVALDNGKFEIEIWPEIGGSVARFDAIEADGSRTPLFRPAADGKETYFATDLGCFPLFPYSNRIAQGRMTFEGRETDLALNIKDHPHALHGVGWQRPWVVEEVTDTSIRLGFRHAPDAYWPFAFSAEQVFSLTSEGLTVTSALRNESGEMMPYGLGLHPYIKRPEGTKLFAHVDGVWLTDDTVMPVSYAPKLPTEWDLPSGASLDGVFMDNCFTGLSGAVKVQWPDGSALKIEGEDALKFLVVYNPPAEDYVCVEPVSHMTDAVNRVAREGNATGFTQLRPGERAATVHRFTYIKGPVS